jgi:predicted metal-dependent hydrolase
MPRDRYGRPRPRGSADALASRPTPEAAVGSVVEAFDMAVELFDEQRFFEAHEFFEFIWNHAPADERPFWKALTQQAAGLCHCQRGNARGALALLARSASVLAEHRSPYRGVDIEALLEADHRLAAEIQHRGASPDLDFPRFPLA